jgi:hypothetical protein
VLSQSARFYDGPVLVINVGYIITRWVAAAAMPITADRLLSARLAWARHLMVKSGRNNNKRGVAQAR